MRKFDRSSERGARHALYTLLNSKKKNESIKDILRWFSAWVCSEYVLKILANLSLIMIVPIKRFLLHYTDKIRNLPRGIDLQIWMQIVQMFLERNTPLEV